MKRVLRGGVRWLWYLAAATVVLCAALVSLGQYYFPYLDEYRGELVARATARLPFGIEVAGLRAEWTALAPTFHVEGLRLYAREEPAITILSSSRSDLRIDIVRSLLARAPRIRSIAASDVQLGFREDGAGHWHLAGIGAARAPANRDAILDFFLAIEDISLERSRLVLSPARGAAIETQDASIHMQNFRRLRRLDARFRDDATGGSLDLLVETDGDPRKRGDFEAYAWLRLRDARLARLQPLAGATLRLPRAELSGELWASLKADGSMSLQGDLRAPAIAFEPQPAGRSLEPLRDLDTRFALRREGDTTTLWLDHLRGSWYAQDIDLGHARLERRTMPGGTQYAGAADYLDVGALSGIVMGAGLLQGPFGDALVDLSPYGGLADVHLDIDGQQGKPAGFRLRARLEDVSASPWRNAPGVRNARGYVDFGPAGGFVDFDTQAITLEFPRLYHEDLDVSAARGRVTWTRDESGLSVGSELLELHQGETPYSARFGLRLNRDPTLEDEFTLAASVRNADASLHESLVPYTLDRGLRHWLQQAIRQGRVDAGSFAFRTAFGRPDGSRASTSQLALEVSDATIDYHPDWPPVSGAHARVQIDDKRIRVWADAGEVLGARLRDALVDVSLVAGQKRLGIKGHADADLGQVLQLVNGSPLARITRGALRDWRGSGATDVDLDLDLPLGKPIDATARIGVHAAINGGTLQLGRLGLRLAQIAGPLDYSLRGGLRSEALSGSLWDRPFTAHLGPREGAVDRLQIDATGTAGVPDVERWLSLSSGGLLAGETPFTVRLEQRDHGFATHIASSLQGVGSTAPLPLGKDLAAAWPLDIRWEPGEQGTRIDARIEGLGALSLRRPADGATAGEIVLGEGAAPEAGGRGIGLRGHVASADAAGWIVAVSRLVSLNAGGLGAGDGFHIDGLRVDSARLLRPDLAGLELRSRRDSESFVIGFGADLLAGEFRLPADRAMPFGLTLDRIELAPFFATPVVAADATPTPAPEVSAGADLVQPPDPWDALAEAHVPPIDVKILSARSGPRDLGSWQFRIASETDALALSGATATMPGMTLGGITDARGADLRLRWIAGKPRTELAVGLRFDSPGDFFRNWGYGPVLEGHDGRAEASLSWPGNPLALRMADATGLLDFEFSNGRLLRGGGNNPLMRAFGVLRFDELLRRLKLDFKDLYQSGLSFDRFEAAINVADGLARTSEPMDLRGPTARMRLSGESDLRRNLIDADLVVSLPLGSNLPWVAGLAGGLPAVAGAYLASRIFEDQLGRFSSAGYKVTGPLDEPKLELVKVFDAGPAASPPMAGAKATSATAAPEAPAVTVPSNEGPSP